jgi:hypothetical protein
VEENPDALEILLTHTKKEKREESDEERRREKRDEEARGDNDDDDCSQTHDQPSYVERKTECKQQLA